MASSKNFDSPGLIRNGTTVIILDLLESDYDKLFEAAKKVLPTGEKCASIVMASVPRKGESVALGENFYKVQTVQWLMSDNKMLYPVLSVFLASE